MENLLLYLKKKNIEHFENQVIKPYISIKIGGKVKLTIIVKKTSILTELLPEYLHNQYAFVLIGGGSNVIFSDKYSNFIVIINQTSEIIEYKKNLLKVNSGVPNQLLMNWCKKNHFSGLEFLAGIPGTIGGAAAVNAGAFGESMSTVIEKAEIIDEKGAVKSVDPQYFQFDYRNSIFKTSNQIILNLFLKGHADKKSEIEKRITSNIKYRKKNHPPYSQLTAGCFFKNPQTSNQRISAGKIIENSGLKGVKQNNLSVSDIHSNFIINRGKASFAEIIKLEQMIARNVFHKQGIQLEREVIYISPDGKKY